MKKHPRLKINHGRLPGGRRVYRGDGWPPYLAIDLEDGHLWIDCPIHRMWCHAAAPSKAYARRTGRMAVCAEHQVATQEALKQRRRLKQARLWRAWELASGRRAPP